jgi:hypothetical protein
MFKPAFVSPVDTGMAREAGPPFSNLVPSVGESATNQSAAFGAARNGRQRKGGKDSRAGILAEAQLTSW